MLGLLIIFRIGIKVCQTHLSRWVGGLLLGTYLAFLVLNYLV